MDFYVFIYVTCTCTTSNLKRLAIMIWVSIHTDPAPNKSILFELRPRRNCATRRYPLHWRLVYIPTQTAMTEGSNYDFLFKVRFQLIKEKRSSLDHLVSIRSSSSVTLVSESRTSFLDRFVSNCCTKRLLSFRNRMCHGTSELWRPLTHCRIFCLQCFRDSHVTSSTLNQSQLSV